jgi:3-dehydrocarnitine:acetyl-CoA trimethylamine transferase
VLTSDWRELTRRAPEDREGWGAASRDTTGVGWSFWRSKERPDERRKEGVVNHEVIVSCAVTGGAEPVQHRPKSPQEIADAAIEAAQAGAAIVHVHVREPDTGAPSRKVEYYRQVVELIRNSSVDVIINLTTGMGGDIVFEDADLSRYGDGSDFVPALERLPHIEELHPEICSLDCGPVEFSEQLVQIFTTEMVRRMAQRMHELGVKPEIEIFDFGGLTIAKQMIAEGLVDDPPWFQICLGIPWSTPATTHTMKALADALPADSLWSGFGLSRMEMPMVAQAVLLGGNARVGLEDNLYLARGVPATNAELVERAIAIIGYLGGRAVSPDEARKKLGLH